MKRLAFALSLTVLAFAVAIQAQMPAQTEIEHATQELITLEKGWMEAYLKKDIAFLY